MISIAISIGLFLGYWASPGTIIADLMRSIGLGNTVLAKTLIAPIIQYAIPTVIAYLILNRPNVTARITATEKELWILRLCNAISIAYVAIRTFAGLIQGGGPAFVVSQFSIFTIAPAIVVSWFFVNFTVIFPLLRDNPVIQYFQLEHERYRAV